MTGYGGFWTSPDPIVAYRCVNELPPPTFLARTREPDRSDPAAGRIARSQRRFRVPRRARRNRGPGPFPPAGGSWDPIAHGSLWRTNGEGELRQISDLKISALLR
jgi:hypothetical protein